MATLPLDVIGSIFVFVDEPRQICLMRLVCRKWADLTTNNLWGRLCARRWRNNPKEAELDMYWLVPVINNGAGSIIDWRSVYWIKHLWDRAMIALAKERTPTKEGSFFNNYGTNIYMNNVINIMESGWLKHAVKFHSKEGITLPQITIGSGAFVHQSDRIYPTDENMLQSVLSFWIELTLVLLYNATTQDQITQIFDGIILETYELYISRMTNLPIKRLVNLAKTVVQIAREKKDQINLFIAWVPKQMFFHYDYEQFNPFIGTIVGVLEQRAIAFGPSTDTAAIQDLIRACMDLYYAWLPRVDKRIWFSYAPFQSYSVTLHAIIRFFNVGNIEFLRPILDEYLQVCDDIHHKMAAIQTVASVASNNVFDRVPRDSEGMQRLVQFKSDMFHSYIKKYYVLIDNVNAINLLLANLISTYTWLTSYPSDGNAVYSQFFADLLRDIFAKPYFNELKAAEEAMQFTNVLTGLNEEFILSLAQICKDDERWRTKAFGYLVNIISKLDEFTKYKELLLTLFNAVFADPTFDDLFLFRKWWSIMRPLITKEEFKQISESLEGHPFKQELDVQITNKSTQY